MAKVKTRFVCRECAYVTPRWLGRCPDCGSFNTFDDETPVKDHEIFTANPGRTKVTTALATTLNDIKPMENNRVTTNLAELDRVFSGGIVEGSLTLIGGDPGIGKSTLLLQICQNICIQGKSVLYVSGEESVHQIKMRAERLEVNSDSLFLLAETNMDTVCQVLNQLRPTVAIIDSIQTMHREELSNSPGSVTQVKECTALMMKIAKTMNISIILVGHVTKEGAIAGPKVLEHMVDTVLYFEGERKDLYRIIRSVKNRFGATNEIGVFEMTERGLIEISNPSEYMLSGRPLNVPGSVVTCTVEGTRPILAEVQSLVTYTNFGMARRVASGMDFNRITMLIAVLEKRMGMQLGTYDTYVNIAGGMKILEPALDAAVVASIASSFKNKPIDPLFSVFGEIGLTGELRAVTMAETRVMEAAKLGLQKCVLPQGNMKGLRAVEGMKIYGARNVSELLELIIAG